MPYWFRVAQCLHLYFKTKVKWQLVNVLKYTISILVTALSMAYKVDKSDGFYAAFIIFSVISACYAYTWDLTWDWGLCRTRKKGRYLLREKLYYPVWSYYALMVLDLIMRFFWVLSLYSSEILATFFWGNYFWVFLTDII